MMFKSALGTPIFSNFFLHAKRERVPHRKLLVILFLGNIFWFKPLVSERKIGGVKKSRYMLTISLIWNRPRI